MNKKQQNKICEGWVDIPGRAGGDSRDCKYRARYKVTHLALKGRDLDDCFKHDRVYHFCGVHVRDFQGSPHTTIEELNSPPRRKNV